MANPLANHTFAISQASAAAAAAAAAASSMPVGKSNAGPAVALSSGQSFMPDSTASDKLLRELYLQKIADEYGTLIDPPQKPLPQLGIEDLEALNSLLKSTVQVSDKSRKNVIEIKIADLLRDIASRIRDRHQAPLDDCEIIGSTMSLILGISYMRRAFAELGLKNAQEFITPQLFQDLQRKVPDYDIRFNVSKADASQLGCFTLEVIGALASQKVQDEQSYYSMCSFIHRFMLEKFKTVSNPTTEYSIIAMGDHKNTTLELLFVKTLPRLHLFRRDALRLSLSNVLKLDAGQSTTISPASDCGFGWQALIDQLAQIVYDRDIESMDIQGWPLFISHITRGARCPIPGFTSDLFDHFVKLSNPGKSLSKQMSDLIYACLANHHHNDPYSAVCLAFNAVSMMPKKHAIQIPSLCKELTLALKQLAPPSPRTASTASEHILEIIFETIDRYPNSTDLLTALLQLMAFCHLSESGHTPNDGKPDFALRKHDGSPHVEIKFASKNGKCSILLPFDPQQAFQLILKSFENNEMPLPNDLVSNIRSIHSLMLPGLDKADKQVPSLIPYLGQLNLDVSLLAESSLKALEGNQPFLQRLGFSIASACERTAPELNLGNRLLGHLPAVMHVSKEGSERRAAVRQIQSVCENRNRVPIACKSVLTMVENTAVPLVNWQKAWLGDLSDTKNEDLCIKACNDFHSYGLAPEEHLSLYEQLLASLIQVQPSMAVPLLIGLLAQAKVTDPFLWNSFCRLMESNRHQRNGHRIKSNLPVLGRFVIGLLARSPSAPQHLQNPALAKEFCHLSELLMDNLGLEEAGEMLRNASQNGFAEVKSLQNLWIKYCKAATEQKGPLKGLEIWVEARQKKIWGTRNLPSEAQGALVSLTTQLYALDPSITEGQELGYFKTCLAEVKDPAYGAEMQALAARHAERLLEKKDTAQALQEIHEIPDKYLTGRGWINVKLRVLKLEISQSKLNKASATLKDILGNSVPPECIPALKENVLAFLDNLAASLHATSQTGWNINMTAQVLMNPKVNELFANDREHFALKLCQFLNAFDQKDLYNSRILLFDLIAQSLQTCLDLSAPTPAPQTKCQLARAMINILDYLCPAKCPFPDSLKTLLPKKADSLLAALEINPSHDSRFSLFKLCHINKLKPELSDDSIRRSLNLISEYLISTDATRQHVLEANQFLADYLKEDAIRNILRTKLSIRLLNNLISALLKQSCPDQALRWLTVLTKLSSVFTSTWNEKVPPKIVEWAPALRSQKNHKKCLELLLLINGACNGLQPAISAELFHLVDDFLIRKDPVACAHILIDHSAILKKDIAGADLQRAAQDSAAALLKAPVNGEKLNACLKLLTQYPSVSGAHWSSALSQCARVNDSHLQQNGWNAFSSATRNSAFLGQEKEVLAQCWVHAIEILGKIGSLEIMVAVNNYSKLKDLFERDAPPKLHEDLLVKLFTGALNLPDSPGRTLFFKDRLISLRRETDEILSRPEFSNGKTAIDLAFVNAFSLANDFSLYMHAYQTFLSVKNPPAMEPFMNCLTNLFKGSCAFKEDSCNGIEKAVHHLQSIAADLQPRYNPAPAIPAFTHHPTMEILMKGLELVWRTFEERLRSAPNNDREAAKSTEGLFDFGAIVVSTNHPDLISRLTRCLGHPTAAQFLTESDRVKLWKMTISKGLRNAIEINRSEFLHFAVEYFLTDFKFIAHDEAASQECIDLFLQCVLMLLCNHSAVTLHTKALRRFNELIQCRTASDPPHHPNPFPLPQARVAQIQFKIVDAILDHVPAHHAPAEILCKYAISAIEQFLKHYHKKHKMLAPLLHKFVFCRMPCIANMFQQHVISCQHLVQRAIALDLLDQHLDMLFEFDIFLNLASEKKRALMEPAAQINQIQRLFHNVCGQNHPLSLWHLIETLEKLQSLEALDKSPETVIDLYRKIIIALRPHMFYQVGGMPIFEHLAQKILSDTRLTGGNKQPAWTNAGTEVITLFIRQIEMLCSSGTPKPESVASKYDPLDYLCTIYLKSVFNGCFEKNYIPYMSLLCSSLPLILPKLQNAQSVTRYSTLALKLITAVDAKQEGPLSLSEMQARANTLAFWVELLAGSGAPGAKAEAAAFLRKCESELKLFKNCPEALARAKAAL